MFTPLLAGDCHTANYRLVLLITPQHRPHREYHSCVTVYGRCLRSHYLAMGIQAYQHFFFSESCTCNICDQPCLPSPWLSSHGDCSPTAPSLRSLVLSGSLIKWKVVQVYHHQPQSMFLLDPVYHIIYLGCYLVRALP
jgi:hypothetical protein